MKYIKEQDFRQHLNLTDIRIQPVTLLEIRIHAALVVIRIPYPIMQDNF